MSKNQEDIASLIKTAFKVKQSKPNHILDQRWLRNQLLDKLNPKEHELVNSAIDILVKDKFITIEDRHGWCMVLTEKGYEEIYPINKAYAIEKIGKAILVRFAEQHSKVGHIIDSKWVNHVLAKTLNPREIELVNEAIENLINKKFITLRNEGVSYSLVLEQAGFDDLYN